MVPAPSAALLTDLYELTMAAALVAGGRADAPATFSLFIRSLPPNRGFLVAAGLDDALRYLYGLRFAEEDLAALARLDLGGGARFPNTFLEWLADVRFRGTVRAVPEGRLVFAGEPLLEVTGPLAVAQLAETFLLNQVTFQTSLATKAARYRHAAAGRRLVDFSLRRAHGSDAGMKVARCSAIAGFAATSNVAAALRYGLAVSGTMAHSYVLAHHSEIEAFRSFAAASPGAVILLVDTYDTAAGVEAAIDVGLELQAGGPRPAGPPAARPGGRSSATAGAWAGARSRLAGIRLDSGDLAGHAALARSRLDAAGLTDVAIFASGGLDEAGVAGLVAAGAPIDGFGIGTALGVSEDVPVLESVYKLVEHAGRPVAKLSTGKATLPGAKALWRRGDFGGDVIGLAGEDPPAGAEALLVPVDGPAADPAGAVVAARQTFEDDWNRLPEEHKHLTTPTPYPVTVSPALEALAAVTTRDAGPSPT